VAFSVFGESCRLVQLVPNAFVVRMSRALGEQEGALLDAQAAAAAARADGDGPGGEVLRDVALRVWAELGRARPAIGRTVDLAPGSVLELDRGVDDPVELFVNGRRFAAGRLLVAEDGDWAVRIDTVDAGLSVGSTITEGVA
jgi:flagellar motor switch protein FliN/FliY